VQRIDAEGRHAASWIRFSDAGDHYPGLCFFDLDPGGRITRITDFWPGPAEVPAGRAHLAGRYCSRRSGQARPWPGRNAVEDNTAG
jgi:hypothetical protein